VVHGRPNPKITWPGDLEVAAALLRARGVDLP
jgi:2-C-methyl-D-erythritol 4-phosphate cytidylyltransferase